MFGEGQRLVCRFSAKLNTLSVPSKCHLKLKNGLLQNFNLVFYIIFNFFLTIFFTFATLKKAGLFKSAMN